MDMFLPSDIAKMIWIYSYKRKAILDMFPNTSMDIFPITTGVENAVLTAIPSSQNMWSASY
jgi:hypothetical protein